jgi:hypothetical protein
MIYFGAVLPGRIQLPASAAEFRYQLGTRS